MWQQYINASSIEEVAGLLAEHGSKARIVAGATDLILEIERGVRTGIEILIDITRIQGLDQITLDLNDRIHLGPLVTHNHCVDSKLIHERSLPLAQAAWEVGAPQIRNRGTVAGNLITASPANDTITPLMAMGAEVTLFSVRGKRIVPLSDFYRGVRRTVMQADEIMVDISFPALKSNQKGKFIKLGLRKAQAISVVNTAVVLTLNDGVIEDAVITLGSVAPMIIHAHAAETFLQGKTLSEEVVLEASKLSAEAAQSIDDVRSSAAYRNEMVRVCVRRALDAIWNQRETDGLPDNPVLLWGKNNNGKTPELKNSTQHFHMSPIETRINGKAYQFTSGGEKTLLRFLREDAGLTGTKEGCAEGECGACTVFLDGIAVMACLVPAARAHGAEIVTIEGLAEGDRLHPVQEAFIEAGAVQCGYCTPGFIMSAAKLLEERSHPDRNEIQQAITGNLCRCTGYYTIVEAIERASVSDNQS